MIPDHIEAILITLVVAWVLLRWGGPIFLAHALFYARAEQWGFAGLALAFACYFAMARTIGVAIQRVTDPANGARN